MRLKIRSKIIIVTALIVSNSLIVSGFFIYDVSREIVSDQSIKDSRTKLAQISFQLNKIQEQVTKTSEYIVSDEEITSLISSKKSTDIAEAYFRKQAVQEKLGRFVALNSFLLNVLIVTPEGEIYSNYSGYEDYFAEYVEQPWFQSMKDSRSGYSEPHPFFFIGGNRQVFSYVLKYRPIGMAQTASGKENYLVIDIAYTELSNVFRQSAADFEQIALYTGTNALLYSTHSEVPQLESLTSDELLSAGVSYYEENNWFIVTDNAMNQGWKQVAYLSKGRLFEKVNRIYSFYVLIIISAIIVTLIVMLPIMVRLIRPIVRLTHAMKRLGVGDLSTSVDIRSGDEFELLGNGFNRMVGDLKTLLDTSIRNEKTKRQMQIDLLMAQINPHFIYNTLNTVIYLAHAERNRQLVEVTQALIGILQDTIKTGEGAVRATLAEEKAIVDKYVLIQQTRYPERFKLEWDVEEDLLSRYVPRMTLQPIVENAIIHGVIPSDQEQGIIQIRAYARQERLIIEIEDNGQGIEPAKAALAKAGRERTRGIGLSNIRERLQTYYDASARLEVMSEPGGGTLVRIVFPLTERKEQLEVGEKS